MVSFFFFLFYFSLALQREQYLREKRESSDAYRKALDTQVKNSTCQRIIVIAKCHPCWPSMVADYPLPSPHLMPFRWNLRQFNLFAF